MKIAIYSDLHTEFDPKGNMWLPPPVDADVMIFAGDIGTAPVHLDRFASLVERAHPNVVKFIYVAGNHEWYSSQSRFGRLGYERYRSALSEHERSVFLEEDHVQVAGKTFVGCTLWTDLSAANPAHLREQLNDYERIRIEQVPYRKLRPADVTKAWRRSVRFLEGRIYAYDHRNTVVVTHHSPTFNGLDRDCGEELLLSNASELDSLIARWQPTLWAHGHVHQRLDRRIGVTRIVCNPRGYNTRAGDALVAGFNPRFTVEV